MLNLIVFLIVMLDYVRCLIKMKDHEFRESVNELKRLVDVHGRTMHLRDVLSRFLMQFREKCK